jgi:hypothetical protein
MSEQISKLAKDMYDEHKTLVHDANVKEHTLLGRKQNLIQVESDEMFGRRSQYNRDSLEADIKARTRGLEVAKKAIELQANLASNDVQESLPEFVADAKDQAEKDGVAINL